MSTRRTARPLRLATTLALLPALVASAPTLAQDLPSGDDLIDKSITAMGGDAIEKIESYASISEMTAPMGTMTSTITWSAPEHVLVKRTIPQLGEIEMGTDGTVGWMLNPMMGGYQLMQADQLQDILDQALHVRILNLRTTLEDMTTRTESVAAAEFDGASCHELSLVGGEADREEHTTVYFDTTSALIRGMKISQLTPAGPDVTVITFRDWKPIDKVLFFHSIEVDSGQVQMSVKYSSIEVNKVDPATLAVPAEVTALAAKQTDGPMALEDFSQQVQQMIQSALDSVNMDDDAALRQARDAIAQQAQRMPGEYRQGMEYVLVRIDDRLAELKKN